MRPLYRRGHMDQVLLTFGFTFVFLDLVQTVWGRVGAAAPGAGGAAGNHADRRRRVLRVSAVPDRLRLCHRAAALAVSSSAAASAPWCEPASTTRDGGRPWRQYPGCCSAACSVLAWRWRRSAASRRAHAQPLSGHGRRNPDPGVHRHRDRRLGQPARRLRRQPADRHRRHLRQSLSAEPRAVPDLSRHDRWCCWSGRRACSASNIPTSRSRRRSAPPPCRPPIPDPRRRARRACWRLLALPFAVSDYPRTLVAEIFIFAIFAMSLDLLLGFTGLMSLGHAAFFGLGAYAVGVLGTHVRHQRLDRRHRRNRARGRSPPA